MTLKIPRVSIGVPVYNGENYLEQGLRSLLDQTFEDFEIIISDNASTDSSGDIALRYQAFDPRIRYSRNQLNIGPVANFNRLFELARGEYFLWAPHDDQFSRTYLEECVRILDIDPEIVLCHSDTAIIDDRGNVVRTIRSRLRTDSRHVHVRFRDLLEDYMCYEMFGVIRSNALRTTRLVGNYGHADGILLAELGLIGRFYHIPECHYFNRVHAGKSVKNYKSYREYTVWLNPSKAGKILLPRWRMGYEYVRAVSRARLSAVDRLRCHLQMGHWVRVFWKSLAWNLVVALRDLVTWPLRRRIGSPRQEDAPAATVPTGTSNVK